MLSLSEISIISVATATAQQVSVTTIMVMRNMHSCLRQKNQKITETNLKTADDSSIDYTLPLAGGSPVSSAVVLCFRAADFCHPLAMVLVQDIHHQRTENSSSL